MLVLSKQEPLLFWKLHIGGWLLYGLGMYLAGAVVLGPWDALLHKIPFITLGFVLTLLLRRLYKRVWNRSLNFPQLVVRAILYSFLFSQIWAACFNYTLWHHIYEVDINEIDSWTNYLRGSLNYTFVFVSWSALYFSIKHYQALQSQKKQTSEVRELAHEAQLKMLRYQLNPHFLFNALNSIHALVRENQARAERMIDALSDFLRYTLIQDETRDVPLREELDAIRNYLNIEKIRFEEKLEISFAIAPDVEYALIPSFLIHPLVENAVKHGMNTSTLPLHVTIHAEQRAGDIWLQVANTGSLAPPTFGDGAIRLHSTGTGLKNIRERLLRQYPKRHVFRVYEKDGWVYAELTLTPALTTAV